MNTISKSSDFTGHVMGQNVPHDLIISNCLAYRDSLRDKVSHKRFMQMIEVKIWDKIKDKVYYKLRKEKTKNKQLSDIITDMSDKMIEKMKYLIEKQRMFKKKYNGSR